MVEDQGVSAKGRAYPVTACQENERRSELCEPVGKRKDKPRKETAQEAGKGAWLHRGRAVEGGLTVEEITLREYRLLKKLARKPIKESSLLPWEKKAMKSLVEKGYAEKVDELLKEE